MKLCLKPLALVAIASTLALASCSGPSNFSYQNVTLTLTVYPNTGGGLPAQNPAGAGGKTGAYEIVSTGVAAIPCIEMKANVTNAPVNPTWKVYPSANTSTGNFGTVNSQTGATNFYCMPGSVPIYTGQALAQAQALGLPQGTTEVVVTNPADPNNPSNVVTAVAYFANQVAGAPTGVLVGFNNLTLGTAVSVPLSGTYQFSGYVAGINGFDPCPTSGAPAGTGAYSVTYQINGVTGGAGTGTGQFGTINSAGLYTAPKAYPSSTVKTASLTALSTACPTIVTTPGITINFP